MERDNITKWKIILLFLCFAFLFPIFHLNGQDLDGCSTLSANVFNMPDTIIDHTQNTYMWQVGDIYRTITLLSTIDGNTRKSFFVLNEENEYLYDDCTKHRVIEMPTSIDIKDFCVFENVCYFCGVKKIPPILIPPELNQPSQVGFIAFINTDSLFSSGADQASYIEVGYEVSKIMAMRDDDDQNATIYAMGTKEILLPPYELPIPCIGCPSPGTVIPPPEYYDFVVLYELSSTTMKYLQSYNYNWNEKFQDISVSTGCVELVSLKYVDTTITSNINQLYTPEGDKISKQLIYRKFTVPSMESKVNYMNIRFFNNQTGMYFDENIEKGIYNVRLDCLDRSSDIFYLSFNYYGEPNTYSTILNKVIFNWGINAAQFNCLLSTELYNGTSSRKIWDVEFDETLQKAFVLMEYTGTTNYDAVYWVNLNGQDGNYFNYNAPSTTYTSQSMLPKDIFYVDVSFDKKYFSSITYLSDYVFRIAGCLKNSTIQNKLAHFQFRGLQGSDCQIMSSHQVKNKPFPILFNYETQYNDMIVNDIGVEIKMMEIPAYIVGSGIGNCLNTDLD